MTFPVAILAGGLGTRLGALTARRPKVLVEIAGLPFLTHQLQLLKRSGLTDIVLCVGHLSEQIEAVAGDGSKLGLRIRYSHDGPVQLGTGGAVRQALPLLGSMFYVLYGDSYLRCDYVAMAEAFAPATSTCDAMMAVLHNRDRWDRSNIAFANARVIRYDKKAPTPDMEYIDYGVSIIKSDALARYPANTAFDLGDVCRALSAEGRMAGYEVTERFYEIGSPAGLTDTAELLESLQDEPRRDTP